MSRKKVYKNKVVAIIQARMNSSRLPGKVMMELLPGMPVIKYFVDRIRKAKLVDDIIIATTNTNCDKDLVEYCRDNLKCLVYKGSEYDVLGRVLNAADIMDAKIIVDITADCPFVDPRQIDILVSQAYNGFQYASNIYPKRTWPDGYDVQVYRYDLLKKINKFVLNRKHRVHVGWNITDQMHNLSKKIKISDYVSQIDYSSINLTLDEVKDFFLLKTIAEHFEIEGIKYTDHHIEDVIGFIDKNKFILEVNKEVERKIPGEG